MRKSHRTLTVTRHQKDNKSKATSSLFPVKLIAKLEMTHSNAYQNRTPTNHMRYIKQKNQQQQKHQPRADSSLILRWASSILMAPKFCPRFLCCTNTNISNAEKAQISMKSGLNIFFVFEEAMFEYLYKVLTLPRPSYYIRKCIVATL